MEFHYRYVRFGTQFVAAEGARSRVLQDASAAEIADDARRLYANELAVDVGGTCWGYQGEPLAVLDHHFQRDGQFPSAAAAVLHNAERIVDRFRNTTGPIWLITHWQSDFDAWCAMYLARGVLQSLDPSAAWSIPGDGWREHGLEPDAWRRGWREIDWYNPRLAGIPADRRFAVLLASMAALVDNSRSVHCPMNRTLDSVLYAALARGREYYSTGAVEFFDAARARLQQESPALNPLYDSVLEDHPLFAPELAMLDRELELYQSDLRRARRTIVYVQRGDEPFGQWFPRVKREPLVDAELSVQPGQLQPSGSQCTAVDGVFILDPQCLLFKDWARRDCEGTTLGRGFTFTAIAYGNQRVGAARNANNYFFSLDPERAIGEGWHLYNVWSRLQAAELRTLLEDDDSRIETVRQQLNSPTEGGAPPETRCRTGFEDRAAGFKQYFDDPWFDGSNYAATIVATPNRGSLLGAPGTRDDLSDDPVALLVQAELDEAALPGKVCVINSTPDARYEYRSVREAIERAGEIPIESYRFARTPLGDGSEPAQISTAEKIGRTLWRLLDVEHDGGIPNDFLDRHLLYNKNRVCVWGRRGVVIAHSKAGEESALRIEARFRELIAMLDQLTPLLEQKTPDSSTVMLSEDALAKTLAHEERLMTQLAEFSLYLATPEGGLLRRFFEASGLARYLDSVHELHLTHSNRLMSQRSDANLGYMARVQNAVEWVEILIVSIYAVELTTTLGETFGFKGWFIGTYAMFLAMLTAFSVGLVLRPWEHMSDEGGEPHTAAPAAAHAHPRGKRRQLASLKTAGTIIVGGLLLFLALGMTFFQRTDGSSGGAHHGTKSEAPPAL